MIELALVAAMQGAPVNLQCDGISNTDRQRAARASVEINGDAVKVQAPSEMFATITGRRQDQWRDLRDVTMTDREIRGFQSPNLVSRMEVVIDRMTGAVRINVRDPLGGDASFGGDCTVVPTTQLF